MPIPNTEYRPPFSRMLFSTHSFPLYTRTKRKEGKGGGVQGKIVAERQSEDPNGMTAIM
jgi:hypothetical protein